MMPIVEQSPGHDHRHGHGHQAFYHPQQHVSQPTGKMQLTLILPNGVPSVIHVDANTPMMDLLVQAASLNKLNPSGYSLVVLDSNQHVIHFKANQTVGQIVKSCYLPQIDGSSTISLLPKETTHPIPSSKPKKTQPFEITVRLQVNLPDAQKILLRVDPTLPLHEIKEQICKQKKYARPNEYTLRLPNKLDHPLLLGLSLAEYKTNELTLMHLHQLDFEHHGHVQQLQSFDRLYRTRSESQPPKETLQEVQNEQPCLANTKPTHLLDKHRSSTLRPSHMSLHAYWNDPNFDTQSQISTGSSTTKKRRAPRAPGHTSPNRAEPHMVYIHQHQPSRHAYSPSPPPRLDHHQSRESLISETTRKKRQAPVVVAPRSVDKREEIEQVKQQEQQTLTLHPTARPNLQPPPPPPPAENSAVRASTENVNREFRPSIEVGQKSLDEPEKIDLTMTREDGQRLYNLLQTQTPTSAKLVITTLIPESTNIDVQLRSPVAESQEQSNQESIENGSSTPTSVISPQESDQAMIPTHDESPTSVAVLEPVQCSLPVPKPPRQNASKEKKSATIDGLIRIIDDHTKRAEAYQEKEKQEKDSNESISYFRVAKSRFGKFETDNRGFVLNSAALFDSTAQQQQQKQQQQQQQQQQRKKSISPEIPTSSTEPTIAPAMVPHQTKGKKAYNLLKKYEREEQLQSASPPNPFINTDAKESSPVPIQLEVTERTTHITVTVESDRKQMVTRLSPVPSQTSPVLPIVAPKPFGKATAEYHPVRRPGNGSETVRAADSNEKRSTSIEANARASNSSGSSHETLMESIRRFGGSHNLGRK